MSEIRPNLPALNPHGGPSAPAAAKSAQAAFFRAALGEVQANRATMETPRPASVSRTTASETASGDRPLRPGSLLDIRV